MTSPNASKPGTGYAAILLAVIAVMFATVSCAPAAMRKPDCAAWTTGEFFETASVRDVATCVHTDGDIHARDDNLNTLLHLAARYGNDPAVLDKLIDAGLDVQARNRSRTQPLHYAAGFNDDPAFITTLLSAGADLEGRNGIGFTPLHFAARYNESLTMLTALLGAGADVHSQHGLDGTPLHVAAAFNENAEVVRALIDAGADPESVNRSGFTPLHSAGTNEDRGRHRRPAGSGGRRQRDAPGRRLTAAHRGGSSTGIRK